MVPSEKFQGLILVIIMTIMMIGVIVSSLYIASAEHSTQDSDQGEDQKIFLFHNRDFKLLNELHKVGVGKRCKV
jgi:uncharacterized protein YpmB